MKHRRTQRAAWMAEVEAEVVSLNPALAGRLDWDTATFLFNEGRTVAQAVASLKDSEPAVRWGDFPSR